MDNIVGYKIYYVTGWTTPKIHYLVGAKGKWTTESLTKYNLKKNLYYFEV